MHFHDGPVERFQVRLSAHPHVAAELGLCHFDDTLDAGFAVGGKPPHHRPSEQHALGGYETWLGTNRVETEASVKIVDTLMDLLGRLK